MTARGVIILGDEVGLLFGDSVCEGDVLITLDAMKMEHNLTASADAVVSVLPVSVDDQVEQGALMVVFEETAPQQSQ